METMAAASGGAASAVAQEAGGIAAGEPARRENAEDEAGEKRGSDGKREHASIDGDVIDAGQVGRKEDGGEREQSPGKQDARSAAEGGENERFG